jgi:hypothetical protein
MRALAAAIAVAAVALAQAAPAPADVYLRVQDAYERYGEVPACMFTSGQLEATLSGVDTYGSQYFADFTDAVEAALASRASGACSAGVRPRPHVAVGPVGDGHVPSSPTSPTAAGVPGPILLIGVIALLAALAGTALAALRWAGVEPRWLAASNHLAAEAGYRLSARWDEVLDALGELRAGRLNVRPSPGCTRKRRSARSTRS